MNLIKQEKAKYRNFKNTFCQIDEDGKNRLHYEFLDRITKADKHKRHSPDKECIPTWEPFQSGATKLYNEYCHWYNFRKGRRRLPNELFFFRKGCKK